MNNFKKMISDMVGVSGYETLCKAIFKQRSQSVVDPAEQLLGLLTAPRTVLSWLVANVKPMPVGSHKDIKFPGRDDISIHVEKQDIDVYRAEFVQRGRVIHTFEKQSLPSFASHLVTTGELYEGDDLPTKDELIQEHKKLIPILRSPSHADDLKEADEQEKELEQYEGKKKEKSPAMEMPQAILAINGIKQDPEADKWAWSHANVKELVGVIGKLVDALVERKQSADLDKKELEGDKQKVEESNTPEEIGEKERKAKKKDKSIEEEGMSVAGTIMYGMKGPEKVEEAGEVPESKEVKHKEGLVKEALSPSAVQGASTSAKMNFAGKKNNPNPKVPKAEILSKPYVSDAQRKWAHTDAGKKALGGEKAVEHWDKESKGKKLPEKVSKEEITEKAAVWQTPFSSSNVHNTHVTDIAAAHPPIKPKPEQKAKKNPFKKPAKPIKKDELKPQSESPSSDPRTVHDQPGKSLGVMSDSEARDLMEPGTFSQPPQLVKPADQQLSPTIGDAQPAKSLIPQEPQPANPGIGVMTASQAKEFFRPYRLLQEDPNGVGTGLGVMTPAESQDFFQAGRLQQPEQLQTPREQRGSITTGEGSAPQSFVKEEKPAQSKTPSSRYKEAVQQQDRMQHERAQAGLEHAPYKPPTARDLLRRKRGHSRFQSSRSILKAGEMPSGAAIPKQPKPPQSPKPPIPPGKQPRAQADKQAQMSARGKQAKMPKQKTNQPMPGMSKSIGLSEEHIFAPCPQCGTPEFRKTEDGPKFTPCACFAVESERKQFVKLHKTETGYKLEFDPKADKDSVAAFLLTLKLGLLANKAGRNNE